MPEEKDCVLIWGFTERPRGGRKYLEGIKEITLVRKFGIKKKRATPKQHRLEEKGARGGRKIRGKGYDWRILFGGQPEQRKGDRTLIRSAGGGLVGIIEERFSSEGPIRKK